jgi:Flp pilus assembly protein TadG
LAWDAQLVIAGPEMFQPLRKLPMHLASNSSPRQGDPRRGVAAAELALLAPVLTFVLLMTVDFGRLCYAYITLATCARNGAIYASSNSAALTESPYYSSSNTFAQNTLAAAQADASNLSSLPTIPTHGLQYCSTYSGTYTDYDGSKNGTTDGYVQVTVNWTFNTIVTYPGIPHSMPLSRTVTMRLLPN